MVTLNIKLIKADVMRRFQAEYPTTVDRSLDETAAYGKGLIIRSTAKGARTALRIKMG